MRLVTKGAVTFSAAFVTCTTWLAGMLTIMALQGVPQAQAFQTYVLA